VTVGDLQHQRLYLLSVYLSATTLWHLAPDINEMPTILQFIVVHLLRFVMIVMTYLCGHVLWLLALTMVLFRHADNINANCTVSYKCIGDDTHTHTTLFAIKGSNNKNKQTKQSKRSEINHCKISETQQDNTIQY